MRAAIVAVGQELLGSDRLDTNSLRLTGLLARFGVAVGEKVVIGDDLEAISAAIHRLTASYELVLVTGGLGPTQDDLTREGVAAALGRRLERSPELLAELRRKFARFDLEMPSVNEKQADVIAGARVLDNRRGTAPGQLIESGETTVFLFPGVPAELDGLAEAELEPWLAERGGDEGLESSVLKVACVPESTLEQRLQDFYAAWGESGVALLPSAGQVTIRLDAAGPPAGRAEWLEPRRRALEEELGPDLFATSEEVTLEMAAATALVESGLTLATAESCTGGLVAERLTRVPGSSRFFLGSVVSYSDAVKRDVLGVPAETIERRGAVSRETAEAMAEGLRRLLRADLCVAVTGIAGPGGGSDDKPVGTVHLVLRGPGEESRHRRLLLPGDRDRVRWVTSQWALETVRRVAVRRSEDSG